MKRGSYLHRSQPKITYNCKTAGVNFTSLSLFSFGLGAQWSSWLRVWKLWGKMGHYSACYLETACKAVYEASCVQGKIVKWERKKYPLKSLVIRLTLKHLLSITSKNVFYIKAGQGEMKWTGLETLEGWTALQAACIKSYVFTLLDAWAICLDSYVGTHHCSL